MTDECVIASRVVRVWGEPDACEYLLLQPQDDDDPAMPDAEYRILRETLPARRIALAVFSVDWWNDLTPWPQPPLFRGQAAFGSGAERTLDDLTARLLPALLPREERPRLLLGGYSLAGLFALWAGYQTDRFDAIVAASPSVWYPGWTEYADTHAFRARRAYLSLGDREAKTRHPLMRTVEEALRSQYDVLVRQGVPAAMEFNPGNHFTDAAPRTARGFAWCIGA